VTGAARGLGAEFSTQLAERGLDVIAVDVLGDDLHRTAKQIALRTGREVRPIAVDLSSPDFMAVLAEETGGLEIGLLVSNAAFGSVGLFFDRSLEEKQKAVAVNVQAPLALVHELGPKMVTRGRGGMILVSSGSAQHGSAYVANYAATKAYSLILAEGLWQELRERGVDVMALLPGATLTPGYASSNPRPEGARLLNVMAPQPVVAEALDSLGTGPSRIPGRRNRLNAFLTGRILSRKAAIRLIGSMMRSLYGSQK
jgi:hypothetical protein